MELQKIAQWTGGREDWRRGPRTLGGNIHLWEHYIITQRDVLGLMLQQLNDIEARLNDQRRNWIGKRGDELIDPLYGNRRSLVERTPGPQKGGRKGKGDPGPVRRDDHGRDPYSGKGPLPFNF
jgi:hypothetical protein